MAEIVFGMAVPHSGMLGKAPETWLDDGQRDRRNPALWYRNKVWNWTDLEAERRSGNFPQFLTLEERKTRFEKCQVAMAKMRQAYLDAKVDVAIILGKDQKEVFVDHTPSFAIYTGEESHNGPPQRPVWGPEARVTCKNHPELALHLIKSLEASGFDLTDLLTWPANSWLQNEPIVPHAYGFVYHRVMNNDVVPNVPILVNCFYPPTQPSMGRCIQFGRALRGAVESWDSKARVAIIASGGLSHFVCDETFDRNIIEFLGKSDLNSLAAVDERSYQSGTSEIKLYVPVLVAMEGKNAPMTLVDYVPCYRSEAGTGEGMGFMYWMPR
jgi:3-O-methylgallate 3,4-dioxygenase